jgi:hypothetical protein
MGRAIGAMRMPRLGEPVRAVLGERAGMAQL